MAASCLGFLDAAPMDTIFKVASNLIALVLMVLLGRKVMHRAG